MPWIKVGRVVGPLREHRGSAGDPNDVEGSTLLVLNDVVTPEGPDGIRNLAELASLVRHEKQWRPLLKEAVAGPFLGRAKSWQRVSETWPDPDLGDPELAIEVAAQLAAYISALEPARA